MPGDYLFPKRLFKSGEPLDTVELNDALQVAAERLNGHLGPHNIRAPLDPSLSAAAGTFFRTSTAVVDVDPLMLNASGSNDGASPQPGVPDSFLLEQQTGWIPVTGSEDMIVEVSTGASSLAVTAQAAHCFAGEYGGRGAEFTATVPVFRDPELRNDRRRNAAPPALMTITVRLNGVNYVLSELQVQDARRFGDPQSQSFEIARRIKDAGPASSSATIAANGWPSVTGFSVSRSGRTLTFKQETPAVVSTTPSDFSVTYQSVTGKPINTTVNMTQTKEPVVTFTAVPFNDLQSCSPSVNPKVAVYFPAQIQYAIRVDGVVITETITGRFDNEQAPLTPARIIDPRDKTAVDDGGSDPPGGISGPLLSHFRERPDGINIPMHSVRLTASVDVEPGDHVVELVVRRVPTGRRRSFTPPPPEVGGPDSSTTYLPNDNRVYIYSRQLSVTDVPIEPIDSAVFGTPSVVSSFHDEDVVTKKTLVDDRLQKVANEINDIQSFQVARGAINGDHLQGFSSVIATASVGPFSGTAEVNSATNYYEYPGSTSLSFSADPFAEFTLYKAANNSNWRMLTEALFSADVGSNTATTDCVITVEANVFIELLAQQSTTPKQDEMHLAAAAFVIGLYHETSSSPDYYLWRPSLAWVNSNNYIAYQASKTSDNLYAYSNTVGLNYLSHYGPNRYPSGTPSLVTAGEVPADFVDVPVTAQFNFSGQRPNGLRRGLIRKVTKVAVFASAAWMGSASSAPARFRVREVTLNAVAMKS